MVASRKLGGWAAIAGALLAIVGNAAVRAAAPAVPDRWVSYPLSLRDYELGQVYFAVAQALMAAGIIALVRSPLARPGASWRVFGWLAIVGMLLTVPGELALIPVAGSDVDSPSASAASAAYGIAVLLGNIGLIGFGVLTLRHRRWPAPWRHLPLTIGLFQLVVVTPVALSAGLPARPPLWSSPWRTS